MSRELSQCHNTPLTCGAVWPPFRIETHSCSGGRARSETSSWFYLSGKQGSHQKRLGYGEHQFLHPHSSCGAYSGSLTAAVLPGYSFLPSNSSRETKLCDRSEPLLSTTHFYGGGHGHTATRGRHAVAQRTSLFAAGLVFPQWLSLAVSLLLARGWRRRTHPLREKTGTNSFVVRADFPRSHQQATSREKLQRLCSCAVAARRKGP